MLGRFRTVCSRRIARPTSRPFSTENAQQNTNTHKPKFEPPKQEKKGFFGRVGAFFYSNRQGFINILAVTNYRNNLEIKSIKDEIAVANEHSAKLNSIFEKMKSSNFIDEAVNKVQTSPSVEKKREALRAHITDLLKQEIATELIVDVKEDDLGAVLQEVLAAEESKPQVKKPRMI